MDRMDDSYITDEMLAAYLDGNAHPVENLIVEDAVKCNSTLGEIKNIVCEMKELGMLESTKVEGGSTEAKEQLDINNADLDNNKEQLTDKFIKLF